MACARLDIAVAFFDVKVKDNFMIADKLEARAPKRRKKRKVFLRRVIPVMLSKVKLAECEAVLEVAPRWLQSVIMLLDALLGVLPKSAKLAVDIVSRYFSTISKTHSGRAVIFNDKGRGSRAFAAFWRWVGGHTLPLAALLYFKRLFMRQRSTVERISQNIGISMADSVIGRPRSTSCGGCQSL